MQNLIQSHENKNQLFKYIFSLLQFIVLFNIVEGFLSQKEGNTPRLQALHLWCVKQYVVSLIASDRSAQAKQFLEQVCLF